MARCLYRFVLGSLVFTMLIATVCLAQTPEEELTTAAQLFEEGGRQFGASDYQGALRTWQAALAIYEKLGQKQGLGAVLGNLGLAAKNLGDFPKAIEYHEKAYAIAVETGDRQGEGIELGNLGLAYKDKGDYPRAIEYYHKALAIAEQRGDKQSTGFWYGNLGSANLILGNDRTATGQYEQAIAIAEELGDKQTKGFWLSRLGLAYKMSGNYGKAVECHEKAAAIARELGDKQGEKDEFSNLARVYEATGDARKVIEYGGKALALAEELGDTQGEETELASLVRACERLGDNPKVIEYGEKARALAEKLGDRKYLGGRLFDLGNAFFNLADYRKAIDYYGKALVIVEELKEAHNKGAVLGGMGNAFVRQGDFRQAIGYYEKALAIAEELGDKNGTGTWLGNIAVVYTDLGQYRKAIEHQEKALALAEETGDKQGRDNQLGNLGNSHFSLGDYRKAIEYYEKALALAEELGDKRNINSWLGNLGNCYDMLGDYRKSGDYYLKALAIAEEIGDKHGRESWLNNLGGAFESAGYYPQAIDYYEKALAIAEEIGNKQGKGSTLGNLGLCYSRIGDYGREIDYYLRALAIAEEIGDRKSKGMWLGNLGSAYESLGDYGKAIDYHEKALALAEEIEDKHGKGLQIGSLALISSNVGDYGKAVEYYQKAMAIMAETGDKTTGAILNGNLGEAYLALDRDDEAFSIFSKLDHPLRLGRYFLKKGNFTEARKQFERDRGKYELARDSDMIVADRTGTALSFEGARDYENAYTWYRKAIDFLEDQRSGLAPAEREQFFEGRIFGFARIEAYEGAVRCAFMLNRLDEAFFWAENTRGRLFSELISSRHSGQDYKIPSDLAHEEVDILNRIMINKKQQQAAFQKDNPELLRQLEQEYPALKQKLEALIDRLRRECPQYAAIRYPQPVKLGQLPLKNHETLIEYQVTEPYAIGLVIRDGKVIKGFRIEKTRRELESLIVRFRSPFQEGHNGGEFSPSTAVELADILLKPALSVVPKGEHLVIIPDKSLSLLPFEALLVAVNRNVLAEEKAALAPRMTGAADTDVVDRQAIVRGLSSTHLTRSAGVTIPPRVSTHILFDTGSDRIREGSEKQLQELVAALTSKELKDAVLRIEGHTDSIGDPEYNRKLSLRRAKAVSRYLVQKGRIPEGRLSAAGKGDTEPVAANGSEAGRKKNRRVDIVRIVAAAQARKSSAGQLVTKERDMVYAIDEYPISYYQSASVLSLSRGLHIKRAGGATFFGLGDPVFDAKDERAGNLRSVAIVKKPGAFTPDMAGNEDSADAGYEFPRLPNTAKEIREVGKLFEDSRLLIGPDASKANLKGENLASRRYVLFSTHGILGNEIPYVKQPALVLNLVGNDRDGGFLTASEIFGMSLNADIVGLSACKTGLGVQTAGEGVVGLSRAFMYAGADSVLVSLWSVADESTYRLMVKFFEGIKAGKDKITALKEAKDYLRANGYDNPFYWAPFILMGEVN